MLHGIQHSISLQSFRPFCVKRASSFYENHTLNRIGDIANRNLNIQPLPVYRLSYLNNRRIEVGKNFNGLALCFAQIQIGGASLEIILSVDANNP